MKCLKRLYRKIVKIISGGYLPEDYSGQTDRRADNMPFIDTPPLPIVPEDADDHSLWYPERKVVNKFKSSQMKTRGYYQDGFPRGAVIHSTAGRSRGRDGGSRNAHTPSLQAERQLDYAISSPFCYFIIDLGGNVYQNFPLNQWGYHAGESYYPGAGKKVSKSFVGIELMCAGKVKKVAKTETFKAWFTNLSKGDSPFSLETVEHWDGLENIERGYYHRYSPKQKEALVKLILWMDSQSEHFFLNYVVGHDEVSPGRKSDPGGSLGMTMTQFRDLLRSTKKEEASSIR